MFSFVELNGALELLDDFIQPLDLLVGSIDYLIFNLRSCFPLVMVPHFFDTFRIAEFEVLGEYVDLASIMLACNDPFLTGSFDVFSSVRFDPPSDCGNDRCEGEQAGDEFVGNYHVLKLSGVMKNGL